MTGFTNERFFSLSEKEVLRQERLLEPLRNKHAAELFRAGVLQRVIGAAATGNSYHGLALGSINEGTQFHPVRRTLASMKRLHALAFGIDAGLGGSPEDLAHLDMTPGSPDHSVLGIQLKQLDRTSTTLSIRYYPAGVLLPRSSSDIADAVRPVRGVLADDVTLMIDQLEEIKTFAAKNKLTAVDPHTLGTGLGIHLRATSR